MVKRFLPSQAFRGVNYRRVPRLHLIISFALYITPARYVARWQFRFFTLKFARCDASNGASTQTEALILYLSKGRNSKVETFKTWYLSTWKCVRTNYPKTTEYLINAEYNEAKSMLYHTLSFYTDPFLDLLCCALVLSSNQLCIQLEKCLEDISLW